MVLITAQLLHGGKTYAFCVRTMAGSATRAICMNNMLAIILKELPEKEYLLGVEWLRLTRPASMIPLQHEGCRVSCNEVQRRAMSVLRYRDHLRRWELVIVRPFWVMRGDCPIKQLEISFQMTWHCYVGIQG